MLHSKLDTGNKLSTQTPSSAQWMWTRGHLKSVFTCVVIWISGASSRNCSYNDYRTRVRSLFTLVTNSLTNWLTNWLLLSKLDWCYPGVWRCQLKTCWGCYCCSCWWWGTCWLRLWSPILVKIFRFTFCWYLVETLKLVLGQDSEDVWSRFVQELVIWP